MYLAVERNYVEVVKADTLAFFLILGETFSKPPFSMISAVGFSYLVFVKLRQFPSIPKLAKSFDEKRVLSFVKSFFCIYSSNHDFSFFC